ncbi:related to A.thaliana hyp1 protein [Rhynchosporium agropyri]|uniref:Related to A.thaliana hyp1 protein n=1 Tax=Rhynchosporium agropyri TaxID=914238 RepID=A0A1E1L9R9_9HELO|nr:related to A.thaliana hyp1 protein [Rhynchosporium agropyri]
MADAPDKNQPNVSLSGLVATLAPTALVAGVYFTIFLLLRKSQRRFYAPRTYLGTLREEERSAPLPSGLFNWIGPFWKIPDTYALQHQSLDAYLFLRFLRMTVVIMFVGACITMPVLFPVNITGGGPGGQLDLLSMSHIDKNGHNAKYRYYAHCFCGWIFFGFVLFLVIRESIFYINLRQAFLLSPVYANRISSRTVLFTSVPKPYLDEARLRKVFGDSVKRIWITGDTTLVDELVEERDKVAHQLEAAEVKLIKLANGERIKATKNGASVEQPPIGEGDAESGSLAARWIPLKKRPTHKLGKFGLIGKKVDSIDWCRARLEVLIPEVEAAQASYLAGETDKVGGVFIEFMHQSDAQAAFQALSHHQALHMSPRYIGVNPNEVVWKSQKFTWSARIMRRIAVLGFVTALIVFWAIPVAFVGLVSNIQYLTSYSWLAWLNKIPKSILGVISGLLPSVALAILMSLVPVIMRLCAKQAGEPSTARVELFTQNAYFVFQVVQVFLVVTVASGASSVLKDLIKDPTSITGLLATRLPTVSNFYISYFVVQGLTVAAGVLSQVVGFVIFTLIYKFLASTPRKMYNKWSTLSAISWGSTLPVFTNIAVIGITYSCIAPLVLGFATIGMSLFYLAYRYNILFVTDSQIDTKGLIYPRALQQLLTGVYLAEICLIGLFAIATTIGPLILMIVFLVFTVLVHFSMNAALDPLLYNLPKSLDAEEESFRGSLEAATNDSAIKEKNGSGETTSTAVPQKKPNFITKFLKPHIYSDYATLRSLVPHGLLDADSMYEEATARDAYYPPSVTSTTPLLWIPRDDVGISRQEVSHTSKVIHITDEGCILDAKNKLVWDTEGARPPLWTPKVYY